MGKERFIEAGRAGFKATIEYVNTKPKTILLGGAGIGGAFSTYGVGSGVVIGNETSIIINSIVLLIEARLVDFALTLKNSKSDRRQSDSPK